MRVLVGIVTRNRVDVLPMAIESALRQSYPGVDVVVFDDASTDQTPQLRERYPTVRWERTETQLGLIAARNQLMRSARADLYCSLDDDAWFVAGDEIAYAVRLFEQSPAVSAVAFDILSPDEPHIRERGVPSPSHMYIGCGHVVRLSAARQVGLYVDCPGPYGSEEKDLCLRLLDQGYEVLRLSGVHVWHDKTNTARDFPAQHRSGVCNDLVFALRRYPAPVVFAAVPAKAWAHLRQSVRSGLVWPYLQGLHLFLRHAPSTLASRDPVDRDTIREFHRRREAPMGE